MSEAQVPKVLSLYWRKVWVCTLRTPSGASCFHKRLHFIENLRWIPPACWGEESGDSPQASRHFGLTLSRRTSRATFLVEPLNVGDKLRRYEKRGSVGACVRRLFRLLMPAACRGALYSLSHGGPVAAAVLITSGFPHEWDSKSRGFG